MIGFRPISVSEPRLAGGAVLKETGKEAYGLMTSIRSPAPSM
jgi:hypothetical protein